jgi:hypothetical protein
LLKLKKKNLFILLGIIIILILVIFFIYLQNKPQTPPKMLLSEVEWDFGVVKPNEKPTKVFTIKNEGVEDLLIERVRASCGCVKTSISTKRIKSGKSAELTVTFDTTGYDGKVSKDIFITSNDFQEPEKRMRVFVEVEHQPNPIFNLSPTEWDLSLLSRGDKPSLSLMIENTGDKDLVIDKLEVYKHMSYNVTLPLTILPQGKQEIILTYDSTGHELGEVREAIRIFSNDPKKEALSLLIRGYIKEKEDPIISIWPTSLKLNLKTDLKEGVIEKFVLENLSEENVKIISVSTSADFLAPLRSEFNLNSKGKEDLQVVLFKDKALEEIKGESSEEYIYITIGLPVKITK